jgi:hypothetical protein
VACDGDADSMLQFCLERGDEALPKDEVETASSS